jgi:hypothetical protein
MQSSQNHCALILLAAANFAAIGSLLRIGGIYPLGARSLLLSALSLVGRKCLLMPRVMRR